jgi:hypothetical protein
MCCNSPATFLLLNTASKLNIHSYVTRFRTGKRKKQRLKMVVPVRVRVMGVGRPNATLVAHTLDATESGVKLGGLRGDVNVGDVIEIQHRRERAMFRVVWIQAVEKSGEKHVGAECVDPDKNIWGTDFPQHTDEYEEKEPE